MVEFMTDITAVLGLVTLGLGLCVLGRPPSACPAAAMQECLRP